MKKSAIILLAAALVLCASGCIKGGESTPDNKDIGDSIINDDGTNGTVCVYVIEDEMLTETAEPEQSSF